MGSMNQKCSENNTVSSFCDCIGGHEAADPAAKAFCDRAKTDKNITGQDLAELKMALSDMEEGGCCEC
jgi:hypothetical protein